mgnify:CR=1 FL=1
MTRTPLYRIHSVAARTGIPAATLRAWERRYGLVTPERSGGGYRLYSEDDIARLRRVKELLDSGLKISEASALVMRRGRRTSAAAQSWTNALLAHVRDDLLAAFLELDRERATKLATRLGSLDFARQIEQVYRPVLQEIGERWVRGEVGVAHEHFASAFVREQLVAMRRSLQPHAASGPEAVCAGAPGELHELGLLAAAVHLELFGARVVYLGLEVPLAELSAVLHARQPAALCVSLTTAHDEAATLRLAQALRAAAPPATQVVIGGAGLPPALPGRPAEGLHLLRDIEQVRSLLFVTDPPHPNGDTPPSR